ncbi:juxtaposed with another zinc finger protein 1 isoform X2 [Xiphophorus maculatus]|uniref:JAZF zinc finger 1 n=1 Tax=Xiphophorus maculatus TaxID=8083 RepID=M4AHI0_XIPMA|nr:juxtaposed with another zinc finger protein 1 isoform X2 [Xiphophorus maculatus]
MCGFNHIRACSLSDNYCAFQMKVCSFTSGAAVALQLGLTQLGGVAAPLQLFSPLLRLAASAPMLPAFVSNVTATMTGIAAVSFFSNTCRFAGCGLHFDSLTELIVHIEDNHIETDPCFLEKQEQQQPTYIALSYINRFMTDAARREHEALKKKVQPKLSLTATLSRTNVSTPPRHTSGNLTPPVTPPITPSSSFRSSTPTGSECDDEDVEFEASDSDESWTTESAISSESILSSMCMNGGDEKPFACPVPGCKKRYKNVNGIKYHAKNGHRTQIRVRKPFKCRCGKSYKTSQGLRHHTINFHPPISTDSFRKKQL